MRSQGSNMALLLLPKGNHKNSDSDGSQKSDDEELLSGSSRVRTHDERANSESDDSPSVEQDPKRPCAEISGPDVNIQTFLSCPLIWKSTQIIRIAPLPTRFQPEV